MAAGSEMPCAAISGGDVVYPSLQAAFLKDILILDEVLVELDDTVCPATGNISLNDTPGAVIPSPIISSS